LHDPTTSELPPTPNHTTINTPKSILLFDLANTCQSSHMEIAALALHLKHSAPQYQDYLPLSLPK